MTRFRLILAAAMLAVSVSARGQTTDGGAAEPVSPEQIVEWHEEFVGLYRQEKYSECLPVLLKILEANPEDTIALYNAACVQIKLGNREKAVSLLEAAVYAGFVDFEEMKRDPDLEPVREHPRYLALIAAIDEARERAAGDLEGFARNLLGPRAIYEKDEQLKLVYATNLSPEAFGRMRSIIDRQSAWQIEHLFDAPPDSYVLLMVPDQAQADRILQSVRVGGYYDHDSRRLVTREIGPSLRHEITHALHHAQMDRLGQRHPMWLQEGLASLFEMYDLEADGTLRAEDNTRMNIVINLHRVNGLHEWSALFAEDDRAFFDARVSAKYAQTRAIFQFFLERGVLVEWYRAYIEGYDEDATGLAATKRVFGAEVSEVQQQFREWIAQREKVPEKIADGEPALGLWVMDQQANDGVQIVGVHEGGAARQAAVRGMEVITAIDGEPVFSVEELVAEVSRRSEGDEVTLRLRQGIRIREVVVRLAPVRVPRHPPDRVEPGVPV